MASDKCFFAVDLGATSGRAVVGRLDNGKVALEELTRFRNRLIQACGHFYWDIYALYDEIIHALRFVASRGLHIESIGIDTWGCDFTCFAADGQPLRNPYSYRDPHTEAMMPAYFANAMSRQELYARTGIQIMPFNSVFQLYQMRCDGNVALQNAQTILFTPDALAFMLTGNAVCEQTIASTSQLVNPATKELDEDILNTLGLRCDQFGKMTPPGTIVGTITPEVQRITGLGAVPVVAVAGHDTASAVAVVPAENRNFAYLSSGTWSLMGIESPAPIVNDESYTQNFTNEGGIDSTTRFLKNMCGMWIYERCRSEFDASTDTEHAALQHLAMEQPAFRSIINPDDRLFANPESMTAAINTFCRQTRQPVPESPAAYCRCVFDSLALRYRQVFAALQRFAPFPITALHIIGGGSCNNLMNQLTANACGIPVVAGPAECTAMGNVMIQAKACGLAAETWEMRRIVARSSELRRFVPDGAPAWDDAFARYMELNPAL